MRTLTKPLACLLALLLLAPIARADKPEAAAAFKPYEAWFVLKMGGERAGYMHTQMARQGDTIVTTSRTHLVISRDGVDVKIDQSSRFVETLDHQPIHNAISMNFAIMAINQSLDFTTGEKWTLTAMNAGTTTKTLIDPPKEKWMTPGAMARHLDAAIQRGDKQITVSMLELSLGTTPIAVKMQRGESKNIEVFGKVIPATLWKTTTTAMPGTVIEQWADATGQPVRQRIPFMPGMEMEMLLADKALAMAKFDAPEMIAASLITPDKKIENPRKLQRGVFDLTSPGLKKNLGDAIVNDANQQAKWIDDNTLRITIDLAKAYKQRDKSPGKDFLAASSMLNHKDKAIRKLLEGLPQKDAADQAPYAKAIRAFVQDHIDAKDLSVGFATASEVARTKKGDCTEHACLTAAMLRAAGIPSRTVTGIVYADQFAGREGVFGYHMWAQAWIATDKDKGYWMDLDAALPGDVNHFDATHIALSTTAMNDGKTFNDMVAMMPLMKDLKVKVVALDGKK